MPPRQRLVVLVTLLVALPASAQLSMGPRMSPGGIPVLDNPTPAVAASDVLSPPVGNGANVQPADVLEGLPAKTGQQHWVSLGYSAVQPFTARVGIKVWNRPNGSLWLEAYGGSALFDWMYGFGARLQYTAHQFGNGDQLMVAPGVGAHILPDQRILESRTYRQPSYSFGYYEETYHSNTAVFLATDVDISWLHDFSPHFGFEIGFKLGLAFRASGQVDRRYQIVRSAMFGSNVYPVASVFTGLRF